MKGFQSKEVCHKTFLEFSVSHKGMEMHRSNPSTDMTLHLELPNKVKGIFQQVGRLNCSLAIHILRYLKVSDTSFVLWSFFY